MNYDTLGIVLYSCIAGLIIGVGILVGSYLIFEPIISIEKSKVFNSTSGTYYEGYIEVEHYTELQSIVVIIGTVLVFGSLAITIITVVLNR